jgi:hypothetical protein
MTSVPFSVLYINFRLNYFPKEESPVQSIQDNSPTCEVDKGRPFHGRCMAKNIALDESKQINMNTTIAIPV